MPLFSDGDDGMRGKTADGQVLESPRKQDSDSRASRKPELAGLSCSDGYTQCRQSWPRASREPAADRAKAQSRACGGDEARGWVPSTCPVGGAEHSLRVQCGRTRQKLGHSWGVNEAAEIAEVAEIIALVKELEQIAPWWRGWTRPISQAEITRFELAHAVTLPAGYRTLLTSVGDHAPLPARPGGALAPLAQARSLPTSSAFLGPLASPFLHTGHAAVEIGWDDVSDDYVDPLWLRGCLPLTEAGCDESVVLVVTGPDRGRVWVVTPSGSPQLHPTGLEFTRWYRAELERGLAPERERVNQLAALERRLATDPEDVGAAVALGRALLFDDRSRAASLLERAWAQQHGAHSDMPELIRAIIELDLLTGRGDRLAELDELGKLDSPWHSAHAAIAAARRGDDARAIELFTRGGHHPAFLKQLVAGYHGLALWRSGQARRALEVLRAGAAGFANLALIAKIQAELGDLGAARRTWQRLRLGLAESPDPKPQRRRLADFISLPKPNLAEVDANLAKLQES